MLGILVQNEILEIEDRRRKGHEPKCGCPLCAFRRATRSLTLVANAVDDCECPVCNHLRLTLHEFVLVGMGKMKQAMHNRATKVAANEQITDRDDIEFAAVLGASEFIDALSGWLAALPAHAHRMCQGPVAIITIGDPPAPTQPTDPNIN